MANLGLAYIQGNRGVERNPQLGMKLIYEAVRLGASEQALGYIGSYLMEIKQFTEGIRLLEKAVNAGNNIAACELAVYYFFGRGGVKADRKKAENLLRRAAADTSDPIAQQKARDLMIHCRISNNSTKKSPTKHRRR